jgi:hypothetical protein
VTIKLFLTRNVEGYLFKDLRAMSKIKLKKGQKFGGAGYPMVSAILAGMELLGGLLQEKPFSTQPSAGFDYFNNYWDNYLSATLPKYRPFSTSVRKLVRHGIAHTYLTKTGVWLVKGNPSAHLEVILDSDNYYMIIDVQELFRDFAESYKLMVRPIVWDNQSRGIITKQTMQGRLKEMIEIYEIESNKALSASEIPSFEKSFQTFMSGMRAVAVSGTVVSNSGPRVKAP